MDSELQRQRVSQFELQRERYLSARARATQRTLSANRRLLSTRHRMLPVLLVVPFALLAVAGVLDLLYLLTGNGLWTTLSFAMIPAGCTGVLLAFAVGVHDWLAAPVGSRVRGFGVWYAIGALLVVGIFAQSWIARLGQASEAGGVGVVLGFIGAAFALLAGWLLGEYLDRLAMLRPAELPVQAEIEFLTEPLQVEVDELVERQVAHA